MGLLVTPIILNTAFLSYIELFVTNGIVFESGIVMDFLWVSLLVSITLYACTVFVGMFTGSSIAQIIFTYILNFLPVGIVVLLNYALNGIIFGFAGVSDIFMENLLKISPIVQALDIMNNIEVISSYVWWDVGFVVISLVIGYFVPINASQPSTPKTIFSPNLPCMCIGSFSNTLLSLAIRLKKPSKVVV